MNSQVWIEMGRSLLHHYLTNFGEIDKNDLTSELYEMVNIPDCPQRTMIQIAVLAHAKKIITTLCSTIKLDAVTKNDHQISLNGFDYLFDAYPCKQEDGSVIIKMRPNMSIAECRAKANEIRKAGMGYIQHADEWDHYIEIRLRPGTAAKNDDSFSKSDTGKRLN